jgi:hypothetical protein
VPACLIE